MDSKCAAVLIKFFVLFKNNRKIFVLQSEEVGKVDRLSEAFLG